MTLEYPRPSVLEEIRHGGAKPPRFAAIEASAGTGKTYTLERSVIELLLGGVPAEKLLVVTFTERATCELRERVRELLRRIVGGVLPEGWENARYFWTIDGPERAILERALLAFDEAPIFTIHGFCHRVLAENAFVAGRLFEQELVDAKSAFSSGFMHVLRHELANDPRRAVDLRAWLREHTVDELRDLLQEVDAARAEVRPLLDRDGLLAELEQLKKGVDERLDEVKAAVESSSLHGLTKRAVVARVEALREFVRTPEATGSVVALHVSGKKKYIFDWLLDPERVDDLRAIPGLKKFVKRLEGIQSKLVTVEAAVAQVFLPSVRARVAHEKTTRGQLDFADMLAIVRDAITKGPQRELLLARIRERYAHALIDEFQDTDEVQWAIFEEVFARSPSGHGLWVIGDPKQSIYRWRGADVFAYLRARDVLLAGEEPTRLEENFRSTDALIKAYNFIFDQGAPAPFFRDTIRYDAPVRCGEKKLVALGADEKPVAPIHVFDIAAPSIYAETLRTTLGVRIAVEIDRILRDGLWFGEGEDAKRVEASDIYILTRTVKEGDQIARFLAERRVPFAFYKQDGLFQTEEARDIGHVLAAIDDPRDRSKRARAWLTPFFDLELADLARGDPSPEHPLLERLFEWERLAQRGDFRRLFASIVDETGLIRREIFLAASERRLTNYLHILESLLETVSRRRIGLRELVPLLRSWISKKSAPEGEGNVQRLESDSKAVQIMTLHKSKGLEAAVVFLFGGFTDPKDRTVLVYHEREGEPRTPEDEAREKLGTVVYHDDSGKRLVHVGPLTPRVRARVIQEQEDEKRRLLYVGVTRAKARLYLPAFKRVAKEGRSGLVWNYEHLTGTYAPLAERLDALIHEQEPPAGFEVEKLVPDAAPVAAASPTPAAAAPWTPSPALLAADPKTIEASCSTLLTRCAPLILTSYTRMKKGFTPTAAEIEADTLQEETPPEDAPPSTDVAGEEAPRGGSNTGQFFHDVLEDLPLESFAAAPPFEVWRERDDVKPLFERCMRRRGIAERYLVGSQRIVHRTLTKRLELGGVALDKGLSCCTKNLRELEFAYPIPEDGHVTLPAGSALTVERGWIRGFIDFIFEHEGRAYLLDWKTDTLDGYDCLSVEQHVRSSYWIQVQVYTLALGRMLALEGRGPDDLGGVLYCFLRGMRPEDQPDTGVYFLRPGRDDLRSFERELIAFDYR